MGATTLALRAVFSACRLHMVHSAATVYGPPIGWAHVDRRLHVGR
jgi:hypothetical protein